MDHNNFYKGMLFELEKTALLSAPSAKGTTPQPPTANAAAPAAGNAAGATTAGTNAPAMDPAAEKMQRTMSQTPGFGGPSPGQPAPVAQNQPAPVDPTDTQGTKAAPTKHLLPTSQEEYDKLQGGGMHAWFANHFSTEKGLESELDKTMQSSMGPGGQPKELEPWQQKLLYNNPELRKHFDSNLGTMGAKRIADTSISDAIGNISGDVNPIEQQYRDYGMGQQGIKDQWQKAMADKTYGAASLDEHGRPTLGGAPGGLQTGNFFKDHWGKMLMALLGVGALGWLGHGSGAQQGGNTVINNYGGGQGQPMAPQGGQPQFM